MEFQENKPALIAKSKKLPGVIDIEGVVVHEIGMQEAKKIAKLAFDMLTTKNFSIDDLMDRVTELLPSFVFRGDRPLNEDEIFLKFSELYAIYDVFVEVNPHFLRIFKVALKLSGLSYSTIKMMTSYLFSEEEELPKELEEAMKKMEEMAKDQDDETQENPSSEQEDKAQSKEQSHNEQLTKKKEEKDIKS